MTRCSTAERLPKRDNKTQKKREIEINNKQHGAVLRIIFLFRRIVCVSPLLFFLFSVHLPVLKQRRTVGCVGGPLFFFVPK